MESFVQNQAVTNVEKDASVPRVLCTTMVNVSRVNHVHAIMMEISTRYIYVPHLYVIDTTIIYAYSNYVCMKIS